jgi:hypothetical protein
MYGLPQTGIIAQELLEEHLRKAVHIQSCMLPGYWMHNWRPILFTLVATVLKSSISMKHMSTISSKTLKTDYANDDDWEGTRYLGMAIDWDYTKPEVHLTMLG